MIAALLPGPVAVLVGVFAAVGTVAGAVLTIINLDLAIHKLRAGSARVKATLLKGRR